MLKLKRKILSLIMTAAMVTTLFAGMTISASATVGAYTVTFNTTTGVTVQVNNNTVTSSTSASDGTLSFTTVPASGYSLESITVPDGSTAIITEDSTNNYTISNVEADTTITIIATVPYTGQTSAGYYSISTAAQLAELAATVNAGTSYYGSTFYLLNSIDLYVSDSYGSLSWTGGTQWTPIGYHGRPFDGTFDGQGYAVYNIYINTSTDTHKGLFGSIGEHGVVQNVGVTGSITAYRYEGGITGYNDGTIRYCYNMASVTGNDSGTRGAGGIAGVNAGTITSCYNFGTIYNSYRPAGGIAGIFDPDKTSGMYITNCYNAGSVSSYSGTGWAGAIVATRNYGTISDCYYLDTSANSGVAYGSTSGTTSKTDAEMKLNSFVSTLNSGLSSTVWKYVNNNYPTFVIDNTEKNVILMTSRPNKTVYKVGEIFDPTGMVIATVSGTIITGYSYNMSPLAMTDTSITISGTDNNIPYSFTIPIDVYPELTDATTVYLDGTSQTNGTGKDDTHPLNNLRDAINAATYNGSNGNPLGITVSGTVTISGTETYNPNSITFTRASSTVDPMFNVNAGSGDTVIFTSAILDGNGSGTIFNVTSGNLITRGGIVLRNCATGVNVNGGSLTAYYATIGGTSNSISLNNGTLTINQYNNNNSTSITGPLFINHGTTFNYGGKGIVSGQVVYLNNTSSDAYFKLTGALSSDLYLQCADDSIGTYVASASNTILTTTTMGHFKYYGATHTFDKTASGSPRYVYIAS